MPRTSSNARLRLVHGPQDCDHADATEQRSYVLQSIDASPMKMNAQPLQQLLRSMRNDEQIEFSHTFRPQQDEKGPSTETKYALVVTASAPPGRAEDLSIRLIDALRASCALAEFAQSNLAADATPDQMPHRVNLQLAPLRVRARTTGPLARLDFDVQEDGLELPSPGDLPNWALSYLLEEDLRLPAVLRFSVRLRSMQLSDSECRELARTRHRLAAGALAVFQQCTPTEDYAIDTALSTDTSQLLKNWLLDPRGYVMDCLVESSDPLSDLVTSRIACDVFGGRKFAVSELDFGSEVAPLKAGLSQGVRYEQCLPGVFPALQLLAKLGFKRHFPRPSIMPPSHGGAIVGVTPCGRRTGPVAIPDAVRAQHVAIFGATGSGKSTMMLRMLAQDIASPSRPAVILIDPHGTLVHDALRFIPRHRINDVVVVDVNDRNFCASINPLEGMANDPGYATYMANEVIALIESLFETADSKGPQLRAHLKTLLLLGTCHKPVGETFMQITRLIEDADFADYLLAKCRNRKVTEAFSILKNSPSSDTGWKAWKPYLLARLAPFVDSPAMKRLLSTPTNPIDLRACIAEGKIILFNISKSMLGEVECRIVGSLLLSRIFGIAMERGMQPNRQHSPICLYIDELATFATSTLPRMVSEARKFNLCLTTANQSLDQLRDPAGNASVGRSILSNAATKIMMRLGPSDIGLLGPYFRPAFNDNDMANLPDFHGVACLLNEGRPLPPFVVETSRPELPEGESSNASEVVALSNAKYTREISDVNAQLAKVYDLDPSSLSGPPDTVETAPVALPACRVGGGDGFSTTLAAQ